MTTDISADLLPLAGVRVVEMGRLIAAPFCAQILGDLGADVIKIERIGSGDDSRTYGPPFLAGDAAAGESPYYMAYNRNKRSIAIDFSKPEGAEMIRRLAAGSQVFIENFKSGTLARYGLDEASIRRVRPDIVYLSVTGFGQDGPGAARPATDVVIQGISGLMSMTGEAEGLPQKVGVSIADMTTGLYGAIGIITSLYRAASGGRPGEAIAASLLDCTMSLMGVPAAWTHMEGAPPRRTGNDARSSVPSGLFACRDGEILLQAAKDADFGKLCKVLGCDELSSDPRFAKRLDRAANYAQLDPLLRARFAQRGRSELYDAMVAADIICGPVNTVGEALADEQVRHNAAEIPSRHAVAPDFPLIGSPLRFAGRAPALVRAPPRLGEHSAEILEELLGLDADSIAKLVERGVVEARGFATAGS